MPLRVNFDSRALTFRAFLPINSTMSLDQIALLFILKNMGRVEDVKKHLIASLRELTLAMGSSLAIVNQTASEHGLNRKFPLAETLIKKADSLLQFASEMFPTPDEAARLKSEVLSSVIAILDEESARLADHPAPSSELQREALASIRKALAKRLARDDAPARTTENAAENDALSTHDKSHLKRPIAI